MSINVYSALQDQKEALSQIEDFMKHEGIQEGSKIRTVPDSFYIKEYEELIFIMEDSYGVMCSEKKSPERQQQIFNLLFDRKTTQVKSEDNLLVVRKRLFGVEYQKENLQGSVKVRKKPEESSLFVEINLEIKVREALCQPGKSRTSGIVNSTERNKKRLSSSTVPQETIKIYLTSIPKTTIDNMEERDSRKEGILSGKPLRINILKGNGRENVQKLLRKTVPGKLTALCQQGTLSGNMNTHQTERSQVCGNTGIERYICGDRYCGIAGGSMDGEKLLVGTVKNIVECETRQDYVRVMQYPVGLI